MVYGRLWMSDQNIISVFLPNKNQQDALFYCQFISVINLYIFWAGLLLIIRRYVSVYTAIGICQSLFWLAASKVGVEQFRPDVASCQPK